MEKLIKLKFHTIEPSISSKQTFILVLIEAKTIKTTRRFLRILIGAQEAQAIIIAAEKIKTSRPLTHKLFKNLADNLNLYIKEVVISKFQDGIFYSNIVFVKDNKDIIIDARASDAIALSFYFNCPIYASDDVITTVGEEVQIVNIINALDKNTIETKTENSDDNKLSKLSTTQLETLLQETIETENFELASQIRDEIKKRKKNK